MKYYLDVSKKHNLNKNDISNNFFMLKVLWKREYMINGGIILLHKIDKRIS